MSDLVAFLRARLDDDEAEAQATADADEEFWADVKGDGTHFDRWSPARVLREVEAKRAILGWADSPALPDYEKRYVLIALANVYRDHPDYDPSWEQ